MGAIDVVTVQNSGTNIYMNITKKIRKEFPVKKGENLILTVVDGKMIVQKQDNK